MNQEFVWAVDVAVAHLAFAYAQHPTGPIDTTTLRLDTEFREGERLAMIDRRVRHYAARQAAVYPPAVVWLEQPTGAHPKPALMYAAGVVQAALFAQLAVPVWTIPPASWKRNSVGHGNATKDQVAAWVYERGGRCDTQDQADAYAIAAAGRAMLTARKWDAAA